MRVQHSSKLEKRVYCCYSLNLRNYLSSLGIMYEVAGLNPNSKKMFWVYIKDEELDKALDNWK